jgi:hypothetical protein
VNRSILLLAGLALAWVTLVVGRPAVTARPLDGQKVLNPTQDTYVTQASPELELGFEKDIETGIQRDQTYWLLVQFDVPGKLPTGATITKATLRMFCTLSEIATGDTHRFDISQASKPWGEIGTSWKKKPNDVGPKVQMDLSACPKNGDWQEGDVTIPVAQWYAGTLDNNGFIVSPMQDKPAKLYTFTSREGGDPYPIGNQPQLVIQYTGGVTPTFTPSVTPIPSDTPTPSETPEPSLTPTATETLPPSDTPTITNTPEDTSTPTPTEPPTATPRPRDVYLPLAQKAYNLR